MCSSFYLVLVLVIFIGKLASCTFFKLFYITWLTDNKVDSCITQIQFKKEYECYLIGGKCAGLFSNITIKFHKIQ